MTAIDSSRDLDPKLFLYSRLALGGACAALADWLFYGHVVGLSFAIFLMVLAALTALANPLVAPRRQQGLALALLAAGLLPSIETLDLLSAAFGELSLAVFALLIVSRERYGWRERLANAAATPFLGPLWLLGDLSRARPLAPRGALASRLRVWIAPLGLLAVFLMLFVQANPLIENAVAAFDPLAAMFDFSPLRFLFWTLAICLVWPLLRLRVAPRLTRNSPAAQAADADGLLGARAIMNALLLCNVLFAVQTALDLAFLWGGVVLPDGTTYAAYAHRGAYPLLASVLIAAGFALIAMRRGGPARTAPLIRPLTLAFVAQNMLLVVSSLLRLDLYVAAYSLTLLRAETFVWMGLVAVGLALMLVQMVRGKPLSWLVDGNALALALTLYACCFVNFPHLVARYNVAHSREMGGAGPALDADYLISLGPEAVEAVDVFLRAAPVADGGGVRALRCWRAGVTENVDAGGWRAWSFRSWRLRRYLARDGHAAAADAAPRHEAFARDP